MNLVLEEIYSFEGNLLVLVDLIDSHSNNIAVLKPIGNSSFFSELFSIESYQYSDNGDCFFLPEEVFKLFLRNSDKKGYSIPESIWNTITDQKGFYDTLKQQVLKGKNILIRNNSNLIGEVILSEIDLLKIERLLTQ